jgi:hypothetical protein
LVSTNGFKDGGESLFLCGFQPLYTSPPTPLHKERGEKIRGLKPTEEPALEPEIINRLLKQTAKDRPAATSYARFFERCV